MSYSRLYALLALTFLCGLFACSTEEQEASQTAPLPEMSSVSFAKLDFAAMPTDFAEAISIVRASQRWNSHDSAFTKGAERGGDPRDSMSLQMNPELLEAAFEAGSSFLVNWQLPKGNFRYMYDWLTGTWVEDDHQVRQPAHFGASQPVTATSHPMPARWLSTRGFVSGLPTPSKDLLRAPCRCATPATTPFIRAA